MGGEAKGMRGEVRGGDGKEGEVGRWGRGDVTTFRPLPPPAPTPPRPHKWVMPHNAVVTPAPPPAKSDDVRKVYEQAGLEPGGGNSQQFAQLFLKDVQKWAKVAKAAHVKVD